MYTCLDNGEAFLLPRERIPSDWWNAPVGSHSSGVPLVRKIEEILLAGTNIPIKAFALTTFAPLPFPSLVDVDSNRVTMPQEVEYLAVLLWSSARYERGFGASIHPELRGTHTAFGRPTC